MSKAIVNYIEPSALEQSTDVIEAAGNIIQNGGTVIFPTETVYGLGANALDPRAARRIYRAKGRPSDNPLIVHIADIEMLDSIAKNISDSARKLMDRYWPGPLTLIFYKKDAVPSETTGGLETVAVRMPSDPIACALIRAAGVPIAAPSANISGKPSITTGQDAIREMAERVDMILLSTDSEIGIESTVVDTTTTLPIVLRPGKVHQNKILETIAESEEEFAQLRLAYESLRSSMRTNEGEPKSPGMKYTHYSPDAQLLLLRQEEILDVIREHPEESIRVLTTDRNLHLYGEKGVSLGSSSEEIGKRLFRVLREMDEQGVALILCEDFTQSSHADFLEAIMNRIKKAADNIQE